MTLKNLISVVASTVCLLVTVSAQKLQSRPAETGLALEVTYLAGRPPAYQPVPWSNVPRRGPWYALFGRVAGWQLPAGSQPIRAVRVVSYLDGDTVRVTVSVLQGVKFQDAETVVATHVARENEKLTVAALKNFGVEPFDIKVVRVTSQTYDAPSIVNNTKSLEVVAIEPMISTFPGCKLTLHNLSEKNISALKINILGDGQIKLSGMLQGKDGEPLIKARDFGEVKQPLSTRAQITPGGYAPSAPPEQQILIALLVYEDGSYEGEAEAAATYRGFEVGQKTELKRIIPLLETALVTSASAEKLKTQLSALSYDVEEADVNALANAFPGLDRPGLKSPIEIAIHNFRKEVLDELESFQQNQDSAQSFRRWLTGIRDRYSNWLSQLS